MEARLFQIEAWSMIKSIFTLLLIPTLIGMMTSKYLPSFTSRIQRTVKILSFIIFIGFIIFAVIGNMENIKKHLHIVFYIVIIHNSLALLIGYTFSKLLRCSDKDARSISIETGIQNSGLALILIFNFFDGNGGMALIAAWWSIWHLISAFAVSMWWRKKKK
jgi:BASS family bile acid:Na+ symporter